MTDSDFHVVKPVEGLPQVQGLAPTSRRQEHKRRQKEREARQPEHDVEPDEAAETPSSPGDDDTHAIDYCA